MTYEARLKRHMVRRGRLVTVEAVTDPNTAAAHAELEMAELERLTTPQAIIQNPKAESPPKADKPKK